MLAEPCLFERSFKNVMLYSKLFPKTLKHAPSGAESVNHQLLVRGGFIDQLMAGSFSLLPLGWRVYLKIESVIREELDKVGCQEMLMPLLHPREIWDKTGRWSDPDVKKIMYQFKDIHNREFGLSFTHEEIVMYTLGKFIKSYKDLPVAIYHFSTKFRNEPRAKSGLLRGREFIMKDLYSAHISEEDMINYYEKVKEAYVKIFNRMDLEVIVTQASGGVFTSGFTHEFQVLCETGEDEIIYCPGGDFAQNVEIAQVKEGKQCDLGHGSLRRAKTIEVGNIFPLGTKYAKAMNVTVKDKKGQDQDVWFASYGIGMTRLIGTFAEVFHDDKGIIWPESVAPYQVHLVGLDMEDKSVAEQAEKTYKLLQAESVEVLFDDRSDVSAGAKFADADLVGIPYRIVVSKKTKDKLEVKKRLGKETKFVSFGELLKMLAF